MKHETDTVKGLFDFGAEKQAAPEDLRSILDDIESIAYRRRDHERNAMLMKVVNSVPGYAKLLVKAQKETKTLATIPPEVLHWDVEVFRERSAHDEVKHALLDKSSTQCVVVYGMGGTGKTVCAVSIVKDLAIRQHFQRFVWVTIGNDASIEELQETMLQQLANRGMPSDDCSSEKSGRLKILQEAALDIKGRVLVVLDDPWQSEQVSPHIARLYCWY
jgi:hypothetical protein